MSEKLTKENVLELFENAQKSIVREETNTKAGNRLFTCGHYLLTEKDLIQLFKRNGNKKETLQLMKELSKKNKENLSELLGDE